MSQFRNDENQHSSAVEKKVISVEEFFNKNKNYIWSVLVVIVLCGLAIMGWHKFIYEPSKSQAQAAVFPAENLFRAQQYELALNGDKASNTKGFIEIINEYGSKAGDAVYFYAGICELKLANYQKALDFLKQYNGTEDILKARAIASMGDAYAGLKNYQEAVNCYLKASKVVDNQFTAEYLLKAALLYQMQLNNSAKALEYFKLIKDQYPNSLEAYQIDKYISRIEMQNKK